MDGLVDWWIGGLIDWNELNELNPTRFLAKFALVWLTLVKMAF